MGSQAALRNMRISKSKSLKTHTNIYNTDLRNTKQVFGRSSTTEGSAVLYDGILSGHRRPLEQRDHTGQHWSAKRCVQVS